MKTKNARHLNGYIVVYDPANPRAMHSSNWKGYVYEHIKVAGEFLGRSLHKKEVVHHLDGNRSNNRTENLLVLLRSEHVKLHEWLKSAAARKLAAEHRVNSKNTETNCVICGTTLQAKQKLCCSTVCATKRRAKISHCPGRKELRQDIKAKLSYAAMGCKYGVSDSAVRKWARKYGLLT